MTEDDLQPLSEREGRRPPRGAPFEAVPPHLKGPLRKWLDRELTPTLEQRIGLRLELALGHRPVGLGRTALAWDQRGDLLDAVDLVLQLDPSLRDALAELDEQAEDIRDQHDAPGAVFLEIPEAAEELDELLTDGNSTYRIARQARPLQLVNVVDPTAAAAAAAAIENAPETASDLLASAWVAAHAVHPDPDGAYRNAVRAVEEVARPLVLPDEPGATLGKVNAHLRQAGHKWELALLDKDGASTVTPLLALFERLWEGQVSRHGGGPRSRDQTAEEARAAVQIAVLVVQWLTDGVLRRRTPTSTS